MGQPIYTTLSTCKACNQDDMVRDEDGICQLCARKKVRAKYKELKDCVRCKQFDKVDQKGVCRSCNVLASAKKSYDRVRRKKGESE